MLPGRKRYSPISATGVTSAAEPTTKHSEKVESSSGRMWGSLALAVALVTLVLWFCTKVGFLGAIVTGVVLLAIGVFALRDKGGAGH